MAMKKFINDPDNLTAELLEGMCMAYPHKVKLEKEKLGQVRWQANHECRHVGPSPGSSGQT